METVMFTDSECASILYERVEDSYKELFKKMEFISSEAAFPGRVMVVYSLDRDGQPTDIEFVRIQGMSMYMRSSPHIAITFRETTYHLGIVPIQLGDRKLFLSVPQNFKFKWSARKLVEDGVERVTFQQNFAILIHSNSGKEIHRDGADACVTPAIFKARFPNVHMQWSFPRKE